ncbi:ComEC/Rec2 family competence protein [Clostridium saccharoperbutylacetonicum]|uniref:ComEC/Rec2 family competence protein n=1 Tax=Clostridium saccharoperbutylacetonicum TaxID=36745 RepID=UPI0039EBB6D4
MLKKLINYIIIGVVCISIIGCSDKNDIKKIDDSKSENTVSQMEVDYINVGEGDSTLVQFNGKNLLIDSGDDTSVKKVIDYLNGKGIKKIDYLIGSNYYYRNVGGLGDIIDNFEIGKVILTKNQDFEADLRKNIESKAKNKNLSITDIKGGEDPGIELGDVEINILGPIQNIESEYNSLVMKISYGNTAFLFAGSTDDKIEKKLIKSDIDLKSNVLKVSNGGSDKGTSDKFVKAVSPGTAVISVKEGDSKKPGKETIETLKDNNVKVYRTDLDNDIVLKSDGKNVNKVDVNK